MQFMTRGVFDTLIIVVILIGLALAAVRLYKDLSRPLPDDESEQDHDFIPPVDDEDTRPNQAIKQSSDAPIRR